MIMDQHRLQMLWHIRLRKRFCLSEINSFRGISNQLSSPFEQPSWRLREISLLTSEGRQLATSSPKSLNLGERASFGQCAGAMNVRSGTELTAEEMRGQSPSSMMTRHKGHANQIITHIKQHDGPLWCSVPSWPISQYRYWSGSKF